MKKITSLLTLSLLFAAVSAAQVPQYYNSNSGTGINTYPFGQTAGQQIQWLIRPGELNQPFPLPPGHNITVLYFFMGNTATGTFTNLSIRLGQTPLTSLPSGQWYPGQLDLVYSRASVTLSCSNLAWMMITLDQPFFYDPTQSLVISVQQCGTTGLLYVRQGSVTPATRNYASPSGCPQGYVGQDGQWINFGVDAVPASCNYAWQHQSSGTTQPLNSVKSVTDMIGWAAGDNATVRRTTNGGSTWTNANPNPGIIDGDINAIEAIDANTAWCTSTRTGSSYIWKTTNGGVNWFQAFTQNGTGVFINDIKFINAATGFLYGDPVGGRWSLFKTSNGGNTWDSTGLYLQQAGSEFGYANAMIVLGNNIWFGTNNTRIYKSTNFGETWTFGVTTGQTNSFCLHFNSPSTGLTGGTTGVLKTTDGGTTWTSVGTVPGSGIITSMEGANNNFWYARGTGIYISTNSGTNWTQSFTAGGTTADIDFSTQLGCPRGWAGGTGGFVDRMDVLVGVGNNNQEIPGEYKLEQNYPNPFNPATVIRYQLKVNSFVSLKVYDILGREVLTLVGKEMPAGSYEVEFDGSNYSSGLYFYTLKAGEFSDTKKMLLIK